MVVSPTRVPFDSHILFSAFNACLSVKPPDGFEPPYSDYRSLVLPLYDGGICLYRDLNPKLTD